jgi:hypothetical protein
MRTYFFLPNVERRSGKTLTLVASQQPDAS